MTNFQAFCEGFWSAWDFTRPFSEKPKMRRRVEKLEVQWEEGLDLNKSVWDSVGGYFNKAMKTIDEEIKQNDRN
jgi:hypothetical protein